MKEKIKYLIIGLILIVIIIAFFLFFRHSKKEDNTEEGSGIVKITESKNEIPIDKDSSDNKKLYGNWNSVYMEIYINNKLDTTMLGVEDYNIMIAKNDYLDICFVGDGDNCTSMRYSFINNILYLEYDMTYLDSGSEISFKDKYLLVKAKLGDNSYSILYFEPSPEI